MPRRSATLSLLLALVLLAAGCGGDDGDGGAEAGEGRRAAEVRLQLDGADKPQVADFPRPGAGQSMQDFANSIGATGTEVGMATSVFEPGENRIAFGVIEDAVFAYGPTVLYVARTPESTKIDGPYPAPADVLVTEAAFRSQQAATEEDPFAAVYEATGVPLDKPGSYVLLVVSKIDGQLVAAPTELEVREDDKIPDPGDEAPAVETDVVGEDGTIEELDTRRPTARELHTTSFDDAIGKKPTVLLFATPQLCQSRVCGPVVDIALQLKAKYGDRVEVIHQEVYEENDPQKGMREPLKEFGLPTEPWLFTVGKDGRIAARLEGSFGLRAFDRAIQAALQQG